MALWGAEVKAGQDFIHNFSPSRGRLRVTKATLGTQNNLGWSTLEARASDERRATLCTLHPMSKPMCGLELELEEENSVTFFVNGPNSICLSGYYIRAKAPTCTTTRHALLKGTHQEILDRSGDSKKARRDDGKTCHDSNDHESDNQERNDAYKKTNAAPPSPFPTKNTFVKNPNGTSSNNIHQRKSESDIHEISDDEKGPTSKAKEEAILKVETITKGRPDAKVATVGSKVRVKFVGHLRNGDVFDSGGSYQFKLGKRLTKFRYASR
ncbi:hypothetical protein ACQ4PT_013268 [Festuca glaucescens]